jgi:hypothetical protein
VDEVQAVVAVIDALNAAGIPSMLVGSLSSNAYGIPRSTKDADFVVQLGSFRLSELLRFLPAGFRLDSQIGFETITSTTRYRFHCESLSLPFTFELFEISEDPHDKVRFANRVQTSYAGSKAFMPRPEDVVITKLRWGLSGESRRKDIDDVRDVLAVQQGKLDMAYIRQWCRKHGTLELLEKTLQSIPPLPQ